MDLKQVTRFTAPNNETRKKSGIYGFAKDVKAKPDRKKPQDLSTWNLRAARLRASQHMTGGGDNMFRGMCS